MFRALAATAAFFALLIAGMPAHAQEKSAVRPGFAIPQGSAKRILLFRPRIQVGSQSTGGLAEPNADWTAQAKENIEGALRAAQASLGNRLVTVDEPIGAGARVLADYQALFSVIASSVITFQFFPGNRLPTKKRKGQFDWTMGPGVEAIPGAADADYALFLATDDQYGSTGRKVLQVLAAIGPGVAVSSGVHTGYAGLVDLRTGDLMWLNADQQMGGDVRTKDGAVRRVAQLLEGLPGGAPAAAGAQSAAAR